MRNYIKTNILSLGQHFVFFFFFPPPPVPLAVEMESVKNSDLENIGEEGVREKKNSRRASGSHSVQTFTLHSLAVYF